MTDFDPAHIRQCAIAVRDSQDIPEDGRVSVDFAALCALLTAAHDEPSDEQLARLLCAARREDADAKIAVAGDGTGRTWPARPFRWETRTEEAGRLRAMLWPPVLRFRLERHPA